MLFSLKTALQHHLHHLQQFPTGPTTPADEQALRQLLATTIRDLRFFYSDVDAEPASDDKLYPQLRDLVLWQHSLPAPATSLEASFQWSSLHNALLTVLETALADVRLVVS